MHFLGWTSRPASPGKFEMKKQKAKISRPGARIADLCEDDKAKIARLIQRYAAVSKSQAETVESRDKFREEADALKTHFTQKMTELRQYQMKLQNLEAARFAGCFGFMHFLIGLILATSHNLQSKVANFVSRTDVLTSIENGNQCSTRLFFMFWLQLWFRFSKSKSLHQSLHLLHLCPHLTSTCPLSLLSLPPQHLSQRLPLHLRILGHPLSN